jgi:hypothetical protein
MVRMPTCRIDGKEVSRAEFDRVLSTIKETGGWFCAETTTGGRTGWNGVDPRGVKYRYVAVSDGGREVQELVRSQE